MRWEYLVIAPWIWFALSWNVPRGSLFYRGSTILRPLARRFGLRHGWAMFAPDPTRTLRRMQIRILYRNGDVSELDSDAFRDTGLLSEILDIRTRKYEDEFLRRHESDLYIGMLHHIFETVCERDHAIHRIEIHRLVARLPDPPGRLSPDDPFETTLVARWHPQTESPQADLDRDRESDSVSGGHP